MMQYANPVYPATVNANGGLGGFGGGGDGILILLFVILFGGGLGGNKSAQSEVTGFQMGELSGKVATKDSIAALQNNVNQGFAGLSAQSASETAQIQNSTNQGFAGLNTVVQNGFSQTFIGLSDRIATLASSFAQCCCDLKQQLAEGFGQVRYDMANFAAQTNANIADWGNKILADNARRAEAAQAARITQLEIQQALCGVPKVSNMWTYPTPPPTYSQPCCN